MSDKHYVHAPDETELAKVIKGSKSWFETNGTMLIYGVAGVLAVAAVVVYIQRTPAATAPASQALLSASRAGDSLGMQTATPEDFRDIADQFAETEIGTRARLRQADLLLNKASENMFRNRKVALEDLDAAQKAYERLADRKNLNNDVRQRVLAGLARVVESKCDGTPAKTTAAVDAWKKLLDEFPDSKIYKSVADDRIKRLPLESTKSFYAWFQSQDPKPSDDLLMPQDGASKVPDIPNPFELPNFGIPSSGSAPSTGTAPVTGSAPATETPATEKPATEKPAADAPAADSPKTETPDPAAEAPKTDAPAAETPAADVPKDSPAADAPAESTPEPAKDAPAKSGDAPASPDPAPAEPGQPE